ncbi:MAG: hypothetical protein L0338_24735, partial [Acidobacteria bacterium]|nr:hypothetical protein [Acidobacteriota bacterium]
VTGSASILAAVGDIGQHQPNGPVHFGEVLLFTEPVRPASIIERVVKFSAFEAAGTPDDKVSFCKEMGALQIGKAVADASLLFTPRRKGPKKSPSAPGDKGNNGVGNGLDPQPPGNPPINDGPGTGPGNPGNRGGAKNGDGNVGNQTKTKGNNGVGNGLDPQPPGNPPINDGLGTGPGNPGNKKAGTKKP